MEYTIIVKVKGEWYLHCLAGHTEEMANARLQEEQRRYPDKELAIQCYDQEEAADCWWNKWGCE